MRETIAIAGMACRFPGAADPAALWENVLAQRQAFRRIPRERMSRDDYWSADASTPDKTYSFHAALLTGYEFDRAVFRVSRATFDSADLAHWLALDVAAAALADAGIDPPAASTGVIVGNTLTGDGSRAGALRLRWPYVRRVIESVLPPAACAAHLDELERRFKEPFAPIAEDSLAGSLSNTIAGRICNHFGFSGGGYTVDGACSSSLLAVTQACAALAAGEIDFALAGGVDLSIDPFELIGFAKCSALARERMFVYDRRANGFLPGEGCGFVALMRRGDAEAAGARIYATIRGWGISSDGHGGLIRPEVEGQRLALQRAYRKSGVTIDDVTLFEGHGTGTPAGDPVELAALASELTVPRERYVGSIKANIGHTKAAAGIAGLLKATLALHHGVVPPITGCGEPREELLARDAKLRITHEPRPWPHAAPSVAAVSAMGFGGINTHIVLEAEAPARAMLTTSERRMASTPQDAELFLFAASTREDLLSEVAAVATHADSLSLAELADLSEHLGRDIQRRPHRLAVVASTPEELGRALRGGVQVAGGAGRITFLFSGQASPLRSDAGAWARRFPELDLDALHRDARLDEARTLGGTAHAQPAIAAASLAALRTLRHLGIEAACAVGHSLGELTALAWAGALDEADLFTIVLARGAAMQRVAGTGAMLVLACDEHTARDFDTCVAATNARDQTVLSGPRADLERVAARAATRGIAATFLPVAAAFHSPAMAPAAEALRAALAQTRRNPLRRKIISTITGAPLDSNAELTRLLCDQLTSPVLFARAIDAAAEQTDLFIEVGPGTVLTELVSRSTGRRCLATDACGASLRGLLECIGAAFEAGAPLRLDRLFGTRFSRPIELGHRPRFIESPCETRSERPTDGPADVSPAEQTGADADAVTAPLDLLRELIAARTELPLALVEPSSRMLSDLHLSSIIVARVVGEAAQRLSLPPLVDPTLFANATIAETAAALERLREDGAHGQPPRAIAGIADWMRVFRIAGVETPLRSPARTGGSSWRMFGEPWPELERTLGRGLGIVAVLPDDRERCIDVLLAISGAVRDSERLVLVQTFDAAASGSGFARSLHLERPLVSVRIVNVAALDDAAAHHVAAEAMADGDFVEATYAADGTRTEPRVLLCEPEPGGITLSGDDLIVVSGGGKGIGAEAAITLATGSGSRLLLLGRSRPQDDAEVAANLARMRALGLDAEYIVADVTRREEVARALSDRRVTAIVHAAGTNAPRLIEGLDGETIRAAIAPKVGGLGALRDSVDGDALRLLVTFGSVIARTGMRGEAHYALANEWLACDTAAFAASHPRCRTVCIEWSVWSGGGMGARLDAVESLRQQGVTPLDPERALEILAALVHGRGPSPVLVCGRLGDPPTLRFDAAEAPLLRFLETARVVYPGVELVADSSISARSDPYVLDHLFSGEPLLAAVIGLEAMAQAATALTGAAPGTFRDVELRRPITVPVNGQITLRVATLAGEDGVAAAVRSSENGFQLDHFRATLAPPSPARPHAPLVIPDSVVAEGADVYRLLFHTGRFRRVTGYRALDAVSCIAEIEPCGETWFHRYAPRELLIGDPGVRDAAIHALQACVPQHVVLPEAIGELAIFAQLPATPVFVAAHETSRDEATFVYDLSLIDGSGRLLESWRGLRLRAVASRALEDLPPSLWGPYLERAVDAPGLRIVAGRLTSDAAMQRAAATATLPIRRGDGKPSIPNSPLLVSASHAGPITIAVAHAQAVGCDLQQLDGASRELAGGGTLVSLAAAEARETHDLGAARVWSAREALKKATANGAGPLVFDSCGPLLRVTFRAGAFRIDTFRIAGHIAAISWGEAVLRERKETSRVTTRTD